jgi:hypothetical protein
MTESREGRRPTVAQGAVAIIDALGFRGIYRPHGVEKIVKTLSRAKERLEEGHDIRRIVEEPPISIVCFSDTIVMSTYARNGDELGKAVAHLAAAVASFLYQAITDPKRVPLLYRGCIAAGELTVTEDLFIGPAVDEAAEWYERANAAVVWLTPQANRLAAENGVDLALVEWTVPLKQAGSLETLVVNPLWFLGLDREKSIEEHVKKYLDAFERPGGALSVDVIVKKQQTHRFLEVASGHTRMCMREPAGENS